VVNLLIRASLFLSFSLIPSPFRGLIHFVNAGAILRSKEMKAEEKRGGLEMVYHMERDPDQYNPRRAVDWRTPLSENVGGPKLDLTVPVSCARVPYHRQRPGADRQIRQQR
jgi:hypothetical protein